MTYQPITFLHHHQIYLGIYLITGPICLARFGRKHVPAHWDSSRELFSHQSLKRTLFQISASSISDEGNSHFAPNLGCQGGGSRPTTWKCCSNSWVWGAVWDPLIVMEEDDTITEHLKTSRTWFSSDSGMKTEDENLLSGQERDFISSWVKTSCPCVQINV